MSNLKCIDEKKGQMLVPFLLADLRGLEIDVFIDHLTVCNSCLSRYMKGLKILKPVLASHNALYLALFY